MSKTIVLTKNDLKVLCYEGIISKGENIIKLSKNNLGLNIDKLRVLYQQGIMSKGEIKKLI